MAEASYLVKPFRHEAFTSAGADVLEPVEDAASKAGLTHQRVGPDLEVVGDSEQIHALIQNPVVNPEVSTVYLDSVSPEVGACPSS